MTNRAAWPGGYSVRVTAMDILNVSDHIQVSSSGTCCNWMKQGGTAGNCDAVEVLLHRALLKKL